MSYEVDPDALFSAGSADEGGSAPTSPRELSSPGAPVSPNPVAPTSPRSESPDGPSIALVAPATASSAGTGPKPSAPSFGSFNSFRSFGNNAPPRGGPRMHRGGPHIPHGGPHMTRGDQGMRGRDFGGGRPREQPQMVRPPAMPPTRNGAPNRRPMVHADRLRNVQSASKDAEEEENHPAPPRISSRTQARVPAAVEASVSRQNIASILPDDGGRRSKIIAATAERLAEENSAPKRKRPGSLARKRPRSDTIPTPAKRAVVGSEKRPGAALFGDLSTMGRSVVASRGGTRIAGPEKRRSAPSGLPARGAENRTKVVTPVEKKPLYRSARDVYSDATMTKDVLEREQRIQAEEDARLHEKYEILRKQERQERRVQAEAMRQDPTVSSFMRDAHLLERVERHLFTGKQGAAVRDSLAHLNLFHKDIGTDPVTEELWTIHVEDF